MALSDTTVKRVPRRIRFIALFSLCAYQWTGFWPRSLPKNAAWRVFVQTLWRQWAGISSSRAVWSLGTFPWFRDFLHNIWNKPRFYWAGPWKGRLSMLCLVARLASGARAAPECRYLPRLIVNEARCLILLLPACV